MRDIVIHRTQDTPGVLFLADGNFIIEGRAFSKDARKFFEPLINMCRKISIDTMNVEIKLDYLNTSSLKMMVDLLKTIDANSRIKKKEVKWYYEEDDEVILEIGQIIEELTLSTKFFFLEVAGT